MKGKLIWLVASCLVTLALVLASCATAPAEKKEVTPAAPKETTPAAPKEVTPGEKVAVAEEKPKYGGTVILAHRDDIRSFDQVQAAIPNWPIVQVIAYDELLMGDRTMGPAGSGKSDFSQSGFASEGFFKATGSLAESWEVPDNQTLTFKIRKGVRFHNKPPANGRELDAGDVLFTINYMYFNPKVPNTYNVVSAPDGKKVLSATTPDKWTVVVKVEDLAQVFLEDIADKLWIVPRESIEKYGSVADWRNSLGSGPFMLTNYVAGSSISFVRNPDYWMKDPVGPGKGNQLPYLDGIKVLIIGDASTRLAALRTGKLDHVGMAASTIGWDDTESLKKTNPEIKTRELESNTTGILIKSTSKDPLAVPLMNKQVRQALNMAIDRQAMFRDLFGGHGMLRAWAFFPSSPYYSTLDEMVTILEKVYGFKTEDAAMLKKMWEYHPDEAKKLLAEAGYPNGFKTELILSQADVDWASVVKDSWSKIGVDLKLDVREQTVFQSIGNSHAFPAMIQGGGATFLVAGWPERFNALGPSDPRLPRKVSNRVELTDEIVADAMIRFYAAYGDYEKRSQILKELEPYVYQLGWYIEVPAPATYRAWQPWLKAYWGEDAYGNRSSGNWLMFAWYDQELKKQMGY